MARQPADRYATATALAEEIDALAGRRTGLGLAQSRSRVGQAGGSKRHRTIVMAGVTSALAAILLLSGFVIRLNTEKEKLEIANHALFESQQKEEAARQEAEGEFAACFRTTYGTDSTH